MICQFAIFSVGLSRSLKRLWSWKLLPNAPNNVRWTRLNYNCCWIILASHRQRYLLLKNPKLLNKTHKLIFNRIHLFCSLRNNAYSLQCACTNVYSFFKTFFINQWRYGEFSFTASVDSKRFPRSGNLSFGNRKKSRDTKSGEYNIWGMTVEFWP